jgi:ADP-ribose pyrophosphatase YjhB (NUDIX family)
MIQFGERPIIKKWKVLDSTYLFKREYLTVRKDHLVTQSGVDLSDYFVLEYPNWINVIAITDEGLFVIERQYRHGLDIIEFEICAGAIDEGELPVQAAKRELLEETGYGGGNWELFNISSPNPSSMNNVNYTFLAKGVKKIAERSLDSTETIEVCLMSSEEVISLLLKGEISEGIMQAPLWKYFAQIRK